MIEQWILLTAKILFWIGAVFLLFSPLAITKVCFNKWKTERESKEYDEYLIGIGFRVVFVVIRLVIMAYLLWWWK